MLLNLNMIKRRLDNVLDNVGFRMLLNLNMIKHWKFTPKK